MTNLVPVRASSVRASPEVRLLTTKKEHTILLMKSPTMAVYVSVWMHTLLQPVGEGDFTCDDDKAVGGQVALSKRHVVWPLPAIL